MQCLEKQTSYSHPQIAAQIRQYRNWARFSLLLSVAPLAAVTAQSLAPLYQGTQPWEVPLLYYIISGHIYWYMAVCTCYHLLRVPRTVTVTKDEFVLSSYATALSGKVASTPVRLAFEDVIAVKAWITRRGELSQFRIDYFPRRRIFLYAQFVNDIDRLYSEIEHRIPETTQKRVVKSVLVTKAGPIWNFIAIGLFPTLFFVGIMFIRRIIMDQSLFHF